jgi:hypothetical protein
MDGTTEPIVAIIGHPIAGNPSQLAVERALREMKLEWRVLSFDVDPEDVAAALEGFSVLGIAGVLIDPSVMSVASRWYRERTSDGEDGDGAGPAIDCLYRDERRLVGSYERRAWVDELISQQPGDRRILLGDFNDTLPMSRAMVGDDAVALPPDPELIEAADLIVISPAGEGTVALDAEDWPPSERSKLVVDLSGGHPEQEVLKQLGYRVCGTLEQQTGTLQRCLQRWTGNKPSGEVIHDAIEEYFGV